MNRPTSFPQPKPRPRRRAEFVDHVTLYELGSGAQPIAWALQWERPAPDLSDLLAARDPDHPHLLAIWEPLLTKAPSPARAQPYCCYIRTVIFYHRPLMTRTAGRPWRCNGHWHWSKGPAFEEFDKIETRLSWDEVIAFDGDHWIIGGGHVVWKHKRWWMRRTARRDDVPPLHAVS